jgi:hypothetical protein
VGLAAVAVVLRGVRADGEVSVSFAQLRLEFYATISRCFRYTEPKEYDQWWPQWWPQSVHAFEQEMLKEAGRQDTAEEFGRAMACCSGRPWSYYGFDTFWRIWRGVGYPGASKQYAGDFECRDCGIHTEASLEHLPSYPFCPRCLEVEMKSQGGGHPPLHTTGEYDEDAFRLAIHSDASCELV